MPNILVKSATPVYIFYHKPHSNIEGDILIKQSIKVKLLTQSHLLNTMSVMSPQANASFTYLLSIGLHHPKPINPPWILSLTISPPYWNTPSYTLVTSSSLETSISILMFQLTITRLDLNQHVLGATHHARHTLDLVISHKDSSIVDNLKVIDPLISDHSTVIFTLKLPKPPTLGNPSHIGKLNQ